MNKLKELKKKPIEYFLQNISCMEKCYKLKDKICMKKCDKEWIQNTYKFNKDFEKYIKNKNTKN